jgi:fatty acid desaturase
MEKNPHPGPRIREKAMNDASAGAVFPMAEAKHICRDLFEPEPWIYWADLSASASLGWCGFALAVRQPAFSGLQAAGFIVGSLALYRAVIFVHELTHLKKGTFRMFRIVWNLLCGFPLMVPSMLYMGVHIDHHKQKLYGTDGDHEYFDFALEKPRRILFFLAAMPLAPLVFLARFLVLTPLSYLFQPLRKPLWEMASSLAVGSGYKRPIPAADERHIWWIQEFMTFGYAASGVALMAFRILPWKALLVWYLAAAFILFANGLRTLAAHVYRNPPDHVMSFSEQFLDSINIPGRFPLTPLWAPVGLRFHATHHLFPGMPYHRLGEAHRRLMRDLPPGNPYPLALRKSLWRAVSQLWRNARQASRPTSTAA